MATQTFYFIRCRTSAIIPTWIRNADALKLSGEKKQAAVCLVGESPL